MSLTFTKGDIFKTGAQILVNPVNCVGVMGAGLAKQFAQQYPSLLPTYKRACEMGRIRPGIVFPITVEDGTVILNFPTKRHWKDNSNIEDIEAGLVYLQEMLKVGAQGRTVAIPPLGAGLGRLPWPQVKALIEKYLGNVETNILVLEP